MGNTKLSPKSPYNATFCSLKTAEIFKSCLMHLMLANLVIIVVVVYVVVVFCLFIFHLDF